MSPMKSADSKVVMLGMAGVGKSALVVRYLTRRFIWEYDPTLECTYRHQDNVDDESAVFDILDTAGEENGSNLEGYLRWGDGFVLVYSITDRQTFERVKEVKRSLDEAAKSARAVSCVVVGNKTDLEHVRCVTTEEGEQLASDFGVPFFEMSACDGGTDIDEAFHELHREVKRRRHMENKTRRRSSTSVKHLLDKVFTKIQSG